MIMGIKLKRLSRPQMEKVAGGATLTCSRQHGVTVFPLKVVKMLDVHPQAAPLLVTNVSTISQPERVPSIT